MQAASHEPEIARTTLLKPKLAGLCGNQVNADNLRCEAAEKREKTATAQPKTVYQLQVQGFDGLVTF